MSRTLISFAAAALLLAGCTSPAPDPDPEPEVEPEPAPDATTEQIGELTDGPVQDVWVYEQIQAVDEGGVIDITSEVVAGLDTIDEGVDLPGDVTFFPLTIPAHISDETGNVREDLDVVAGLVQDESGESLQVIATPRGERSVDADDVIVLDLGFLGLPRGTPLIASFAFGQGLPAEGEDIEADGAELLSQRMGEDRFQWFAVEEDGRIVPGLLSVLGMLPTAAGARSSTHEGEGHTGDAMYWESDRFVTGVFGGGGGGIPAKAHPIMGPLGKLGGCFKGPLKCISEYFKNMKKGAKKSADSIFNKNLPPNPQPPKPCRDCGGGSGEPHLWTFDQHKYDMQLVGEFAFAVSEDFSVQIRTGPASENGHVSMITAVAVDSGGERFTLEAGREDLLWRAGEPVPDRPIALETDSARLNEHGGQLEISGPGGARLIVNRLGARNFNIAVDPGSITEWEGLLGSPDGEVDNDLITRDGRTVPLDVGLEELHEVFAHSWRVTDAESLFDYGPGEGTEDYTDLSFPSKHVTIDDLDPGLAAIGKELCEAVGITDPTHLQWCIFDFAATGDVSFITAAALTSAIVSPEEGEWFASIPDVTSEHFDPVLTDSHVLIQARSATGKEHRIHALDTITGALDWTAALGEDACVTLTNSGIVAKSTYDGDGLVQLLDDADGSVLAETPTTLDGCDSAVSAGDMALLHSGDEVFGYSGEAESIMFESSVAGLVGRPVVSHDGRVWATAVEDEQGYAYEIEIPSGDLDRTGLSVRTRGNAAGTATGFAVGYDDDGEAGFLLFTPPGGGSSSGERLTPLPIVVDGEEYTQAPKGAISSDGEHVAAYIDGQTVAMLDALTGDVLRIAKPTSFENNHKQLALGGGLVAVGPFGGDSWVEMYDAATGELAWTYEPDSDLAERVGYHDAKRFGPHTPSGRVVVQSAPREEGLVVALVGPGG